MSQSTIMSNYPAGVTALPGSEVFAVGKSIPKAHSHIQQKIPQ